jgi:uncharacterized protein (TIGR03067 family)
MRVTVALLAVLALTAFAPAPFPRAKRSDEPNVTLDRFQGKWRMVKLEGVGQGGTYSPIDWQIKAIRVEGAQWTFLEEGDHENAKYVLVIDPSKRPAHIDFYSGTTRASTAAPYMLGLIRRNGNVVKILYFTTTAAKRAQSFERPPVGWWLLTLQKMN